MFQTVRWSLTLRDDADLSKFFSTNTEKDKLIILVGSADNAKINYASAGKVYNAGYKKTAVLNGRIEDIK